MLQVDPFEAGYPAGGPSPTFARGETVGGATASYCLRSVRLVPNILPDPDVDEFYRVDSGRLRHWAQARLLIIRSKISLCNLGDELDGLSAFLKETGQSLDLYAPTIGDRWFCFDDGMVLLLFTTQPVAKLAGDIAPHMTWCDAWAALSPDGSYVEEPAGGPFGAFLDSTTHFAMGLFAGIDNGRIGDLTGSVTRAIEPDRGVAAMHFRDGALVFYETRRPARLMRRQIAPRAGLSDMWMTIDHNGDEAGGGGSQSNAAAQDVGWTPLDARGLIGSFDPE